MKKRALNKLLGDQRIVIDKLYGFYVLLIDWLSIHQNGGTLLPFFHAHNYRTMAIYGMKELGQALFEELEGSDVSVAYAIDSNPEKVYSEVRLLLPTDELPSVDVIVVTAISHYEEIQNALKDRVMCPIVSLREVVSKS